MEWRDPHLILVSFYWANRDTSIENYGIIRFAGMGLWVPEKKISTSPGSAIITITKIV